MIPIELEKSFSNTYCDFGKCSRFIELEIAKLYFSKVNGIGLLLENFRRFKTISENNKHECSFV